MSEPIKFEYKDQPNRSERKAILRTGSGKDGTPVHPNSRMLLRNATLGDLEVVGDAVNAANKALNDKMDIIIKNTDSAISEDRINFFAFFTYLVEKEILGKDAMEDYQKFKVTYIETMNKAGEFMQQKEQELLKQKEELIQKAQEEAAAKPAESPIIKV